MGRYLVRRLLQGLLVVFFVTVVVFVTTRLVGDPVDVLLPFEATEEQRADFEHQLGLDRSIVHAGYVVPSPHRPPRVPPWGRLRPAR